MLATSTFALLALSSEGGSGSLIDINPGLVVWTAVTFILLLLILKKFAWKPILTALDQRETAIKESLEKAEKAKDEAQRILYENQANLSKAEEESKKILSEASAEIERKKEETFGELKSQIADLIIQTTEKVLGETVDKNVHKRISDKYINEITKN